MTSVTYKHQPAIQATRGNIPIEGTEYIYKVTKLLWPKEIEKILDSELIGFSLHVCCGKSTIGNVRLDLFEKDVDITGDMIRLPFANQSFDTVIIDPPYNSKLQIMHWMLEELSRVARQRIIFQHWFIPMTKHYEYRKCHKYKLTKLYNWMPKSYFGRVQVISIFDKEE